MSGGQDFDSVGFTQAVDDVQARLAVGSERRRVVDGLAIHMTSLDFEVKDSHLADTVIRALIVADHKRVSLGELVLNRIEEAR